MGGVDGPPSAGGFRKPVGGAPFPGSVAGIAPQEPPSELFHYTSPVGLHGILHSGELHATHLNYTNDTAEMAYGMALLRDVLRAETRGLPKDWREIIREGVPLAVARGEDVPNAYAFSLSEEGDLLSQWRAYSNAGAGYAIGLQSAGLQHLSLDGPKSSVHLLQVEYNAKRQRTLLVSQVRPVIRELKDSLVGGRKDQRAAAAAGEMGPSIWEVLGRIKHPGFTEEREWRLMVRHQSTRGARYRPTSTGIVPFLALKSTGGRLPISSVTTGPGLDHGTQARALRGLFDVHGLVASPTKKDFPVLVADLFQGRVSTVSIRQSNATFRRT